MEVWHRASTVMMIKRLHAVRETQVRSLGQKDPLEKGMATHSSILAWRILTGGFLTGGLQSESESRSVVSHSL